MAGRLTRIKAYKASKGHCVYCGKHIRLDYVKGRHDHMELDHVVAKAKGVQVSEIGLQLVNFAIAGRAQIV